MLVPLITRQASNQVEEKENRTDLESRNDSNDNTQQIGMKTNKGRIRRFLSNFLKVLQRATEVQWSELTKN